MKRLLIVILACLSMTACGALTGKTTSSDAKLKAGDTVVFKLSRGSYGEGKIESIDGSRYKIPYGTNTPTVDETDVYSLPKSGADSEFKVGDLVIAKQSGQNLWVAAEVTSADGKAIAVKTITYKQAINLAPEQVIAARPAAVEDFKKLKTEAGFEERTTSMRPTVPAGYVPKKGDKVVAAWSGNSWYAGTVVGKSGEKIKVQWADNSSASDVDMARVGAAPSLGSTGPAFQSGDIVLVKPTSGSYWKFAEVTSGKEVRFKDGETRTVRGDEYILFN